MYWLIAMIFIVALLLVFHRKQQDTHIEEDGGTRHLIDSNAPKTIESTEIVSFFCKFSTTDLLQEDTDLYGEVFILEASENHGRCEARHRPDLHPNKSFVPTQAFFTALQQIVSKYDLAQYNGVFYTVSGLPPDYGIELEIRYASGECIHTSDNQNCFLSLEAIEELYALFSGQS